MLMITLAASIGGVIVISAAMMVGQDWQKPGSYTGISNAGRAPNSTSHCYPFQAGCKNTNNGGFQQSEMTSGQYLSGKTP